MDEIEQRAYRTFRKLKRSRIDATASTSSVAVHNKVYASGAMDAITKDVIAKHRE